MPKYLGKLSSTVVINRPDFNQNSLFTFSSYESGKYIDLRKEKYLLSNFALQLNDR
jgi:hypothetical protein